MRSKVNSLNMSRGQDWSFYGGRGRTGTLYKEGVGQG